MSSGLPAGPDLDTRVARALDLPDAPYSTDIGASWQVAECLRGLGYTVDVDTWAGGGISVRVRTPVDDEQLFVGETPPLALCRAALGVTEEHRRE